FAVKEPRGARLHVFSAPLESLSLCETQTAQQIVQRKDRQPSAVGGQHSACQQGKQFRGSIAVRAKNLFRNVDSGLASVTLEFPLISIQAQAMAESPREKGFSPG